MSCILVWLLEPACKPLQVLAKISLFFMALNVNLMLLFEWFKKKNQNQIKTQKQQQKKAKTKQTVKLLILLAHQRLAVSG